MAADDLMNLGNQARNAADGLSNLYTTLSQGNPSLATANKLMESAANTAAGVASAMGPVGQAFGTTLKAGAATMGALNDQSDRLNRTFNTIGSSGGALGQTFTGMRENANKFGMAIGLNEQYAQQYAKVITQNSKDLARFGGNVTDGTNKLAKSSEAMASVRLALQNIGISYEDQVEGLTDYTRQMTQTGRAQRMTNEELAQGATNYLRSLNDLAAVTGVNTKEQKAAREQALNEQRFGAVMIMQEQRAAELERAGRKAEAKAIRDGMENMQQFNGVVANMSPELAKGMRDLAAGVSTSPEAKKAIQMTGGMGMQIMQDLKKGTISSQEALQKLGQATGQTVDRMAPLAATSDAYAKNFTSITEAQKIRQLADNNVAKQMSDAQDKRIKQEKDMSAEVTQANKAMNSLRASQQQIEKGLEPARREVLEGTSKLATRMAEAAPEISDSIIGFTKEVVTASQKIRSLGDAVDYVIKKIPNAIQLFGGGEGGTTPRPGGGGGGGGTTPRPGGGGEGGGTTPRPAGGGGGTTTRPSGGGGGTETPTLRSTAPVRGTAPQTRMPAGLENLNIKAGAINEQGAPLNPRIIEAAKEIAKTFPNAKFTSFNDPVKGRSANSMHNQGRAVDIVVAPNEVDSLMKLLKELGASKVLNETKAPANPAAAKSWAPHIHAEFLKGGIARGPKSGFPAMLHGTEAIVPLPDGKSIPVESKSINDAVNSMMATLKPMMEKPNMPDNNAVNSMMATLKPMMEKPNMPSGQIKMPQISMPQVSQDMMKDMQVAQESMESKSFNKAVAGSSTAGSTGIGGIPQDKTADAINSMSALLKQLLTVQTDQKATMTKMLQLQRN